MGPCFQVGEQNKQQVPLFACSLEQGGSQSCSLHEVVWMGGSRCQAERGRSGGFAHLLGGVVCRGHVQYSAFALSSKEMIVELSGLFVSFV